MSQEREVTELTVDFELIVPDMEFNNCWHVANWLVNSSAYIHIKLLFKHNYWNQDLTKHWENNGAQLVFYIQHYKKETIEMEATC